MTRAYFRLATVSPYDQVRVDTAAGSDTPADIRTVDQALPIPGAILRADPGGELPDVLGPDGATTLWVKTFGPAGTATGGTPVSGDLGAAPSGQPTLDPENIQDIVGLSAGDGLIYDDPGNTLSVRLSADGANTVMFGSDGGVYVHSTPGGGGGLDPADVAYRHTQVVPATVWTIVHGLGFDPAAQLVIDTDGYVRDGAGVQVMTPGQSMRLSFDAALAGSAYLS